MLVVALLTALVEVVKYLISICGEMTGSGATTVGDALAASRASISTAGAFVTAGIVAVGSFCPEGMGGDGKDMGAGATGGLGCSVMGGGRARKRSGKGPPCGK
jgi:hypothetical protein